MLSSTVNVMGRTALAAPTAASATCHPCPVEAVAGRVIARGKQSESTGLGDWRCGFLCWATTSLRLSFEPVSVASLCLRCSMSLKANSLSPYPAVGWDKKTAIDGQFAAVSRTLLELLLYIQSVARSGPGLPCV